MEQNIEELKAKVEKLEKNIIEITKAQQRTIELVNEFVQKSAENFIAIQKSIENLTKKRISNIMVDY
jgi:dynactin complex subunit